MVQKTSISALVQEGISESRYQFGDILREFDTTSNFLVVGVPDISMAGYGLTKLEFPYGLHFKRLDSGLLVPDPDFIPDLQHHSHLLVKPGIVDSVYNVGKIGHISLSEKAILDSANKPILHAFPELRPFYNGSGHFQ